MAAEKRCGGGCGCNVSSVIEHMILCLLCERLEEAQAEPESLAQETIIQNLDPREATRLGKVRNIGIAVCK